MESRVENDMKMNPIIESRSDLKTENIIQAQAIASMATDLGMSLYDLGSEFRRVFNAKKSQGESATPSDLVWCIGCKIGRDPTKTKEQSQ